VSGQLFPALKTAIDPPKTGENDRLLEGERVQSLRQWIKDETEGQNCLVRCGAPNAQVTRAPA